MASIYADRRARFLERMEPGSVALFPTAPEARRSNDTEYPFRADSDFFYLTGFDEPEALCVLAKGRPGVAFTMFVRPRDKERETWTGRRAGPEGARTNFGAEEAYVWGDLDTKILSLVEDATAVYWNLGRYSDMDHRLAGWLNAIRSKQRQSLAPRKILDPGPIVNEMRMIKTSADLDILRKAVSISAEAHREAMTFTRPGVKEYEVQAVVEYVFRKNGSQAPGYNSIVGSGANATILHYVTNREACKDGDLLLVDAGAELDGFTGDITRTYPVNGTFSRLQRSLYDVVLEAQKRAIAAVKPGATILSIHEITVQALVEGMVKHKLLEGDVPFNLEKETYKKFYMHRTSHWLGMDVHDAGDYILPGQPGAAGARGGSGGEAPGIHAAAARQRKLEPGMVLTIEPGLYIAPDEMLPSDADPAMRGIGIRIEDDVLVTGSGNEILSFDCPKDPAEIERTMARKTIFA